MDAPQAENSALREDGGTATRRHWEDLPFSRSRLGVPWSTARRLQLKGEAFGTQRSGAPRVGSVERSLLWHCTIAAAERSA